MSGALAKPISNRAPTHWPLSTAEVERMEELLRSQIGAVGDLKGQVGKIEGRLDSLEDRFERLDGKIDTLVSMAEQGRGAQLWLAKSTRAAWLVAVAVAGGAAWLLDKFHILGK